MLHPDLMLSFIAGAAIAAGFLLAAIHRLRAGNGGSARIYYAAALVFVGLAAAIFADPDRLVVALADLTGGRAHTATGGN